MTPNSQTQLFGSGACRPVPERSNRAPCLEDADLNILGISMSVALRNSLYCLTPCIKASSIFAAFSLRYSDRTPSIPRPPPTGAVASPILRQATAQISVHSFGLRYLVQHVLKMNQKRSTMRLSWFYQGKSSQKLLCQFVQGTAW